MRKILFFLLLLVNGNLNSQDLSFLVDIIGLEKEIGLERFLEIDFIVEETDDIDGCSVYSLKKDSTKIIYNICPDEEGDQINISVIDRNYINLAFRLEEAKKDTSLLSETLTVCGNTSYRFEKEYEAEIYFIFDHFVDIHVMEVSNSYRYEFMKEHLESNSNFDSKIHGLSHFRNFINSKNSEGVTVEEFLEKFNFRNDFNLLNIMEAETYLIEFRNSKEYQNICEQIRVNFLDDKNYFDSCKVAIMKFQLWFSIIDNFDERLDEKLFKLGIENGKYGTMLMLKFLMESIEGKLKY